MEKRKEVLRKMACGKCKTKDGGKSKGKGPAKGTTKKK